MPGQRCDGDELLIVNVAAINLVGKNGYVVLDRQVRDNLEVFAREHAARGIVREIKDEQLGTIGYLRGQLVEVEAEIRALQ